MLFPYLPGYLAKKAADEIEVELNSDVFAICSVDPPRASTFNTASVVPVVTIIRSPTLSL